MIKLCTSVMSTFGKLKWRYWHGILLGTPLCSCSGLSLLSRLRSLFLLTNLCKFELLVYPTMSRCHQPFSQIYIACQCPTYLPLLWNVKIEMRLWQPWKGTRNGKWFLDQTTNAKNLACVYFDEKWSVHLFCVIRRYS